MVLGDFDCPGLDELRGPGCQVRCGSTAGCERGHRKCEQRQGCGAVNVNDEGTWATLKRLADFGEGPEVVKAAEAYLKHESEAVQKAAKLVVDSAS